MNFERTLEKQLVDKHHLTVQTFLGTKHYSTRTSREIGELAADEATAAAWFFPLSGRNSIVVFVPMSDTYTIIVAGTSGSLQRSTTVTLNVQ